MRGVVGGRQEVGQHSLGLGVTVCLLELGLCPHMPQGGHSKGVGLIEGMSERMTFLWRDINKQTNSI